MPTRQLRSSCPRSSRPCATTPTPKPHSANISRHAKLRWSASGSNNSNQQEKTMTSNPQHNKQEDGANEPARLGLSMLGPPRSSLSGSTAEKDSARRRVLLGNSSRNPQDFVCTVCKCAWYYLHQLL